MTVYAKTTTYGIESKIKDIQNHISEELVWTGTVNIYGKCQRVARNDSVVPEVWTSGDEYKELFMDDTLAGLIFFNVVSRSAEGSQDSAEVDIIFAVNLETIYTTTNREDEKALIDAKRVIQNCGYINELTDINEGIQDVFSGFNIDLLNFRDMQPYYVFSFRVSMNYDNDFCK